MKNPKPNSADVFRSTFPFMFKILFHLFFLTLLVNNCIMGQWLTWTNATSTRLTLSSVANSDPEEKDMWAADLNNDGREDLIVVRKQPFSTSTQPGKSNLLLINVNGHLTDKTLEYAPQFIDSINFARDVFIGDFDGDNWKDVIIANTFGQQPMYYRNRGNDPSGNWLGLINESSLRFPLLTEDTPLICAVWGGDVTGDGKLDIYLINYKPNSGGGIAKDYLLINNGFGYFTNESQVRLGNLRNSAFGTAVQIVDMDNDGDKDIIKNSTLYNVSPWNARGVIVLFNNGNGTFTNWQNLVPANSPYMFEIADFNLDGKKDLYVVDDGSDYILTVTSFIPNTSLTFTKTNLNFSTSNGFGGNVHATDLDLDGDIDIGVADVDVDIPPCNSSRRMAIYRNDGGVFTNVYGTTAFPWADNNYDFFWLDINNDGLKDFVTGFCNGYGVFMNDNCALAPSPADYDLDGLADACDPCPTNPDPNCTPPADYPTVSTDFSIARQWNELLLASIRKDFARPTVHARNLFHISAAMWDAWSAYDANSKEFLLGQTVGGFSCPFNGIPASSDIVSDRNKAISYASYRLLKHRFANSPQAALLNTGYDVHMDTLGYDKNFISTDYSTGNAAALGNYIAQCYITFGLQDGSNEQNAYTNTSYSPVNPPLNVDVPGNPNISDFNRWQPLTLDLFIDQSGNPIPGATPPFLSPEWGQVIPFALDSSDLTINQRNGFNYMVYHDPGPPPYLQMDGSGMSDEYKWGFALVAAWSSHLSPDDSVLWDISPATQGNRDTLPSDFSDYPGFYDLTNGGTTNYGHSVNPATGLPYSPNMVPRGDYARVLAEFWADGPDSETPPGHWFALFNYVSDHPLETKQYKGVGAPLNELEWDVKGYFALGGAMHDVAVSVWGMKGWYDYIRPISAIRGMAELGQSSNPSDMSYHPAGIPLIPGYIELVTAGDPLADGTNNIGKIKLKAWRGHSFINNVDVDEAGVGWILAQDWMPYQRPSFVTPPFAGYISGHSTYSRAAAEILSEITGDRFFPGGLGTFTAQQNQFLVFEDGPSQDIELQWATYQDAADESSMSRIWGGIHPPCDDIPGRILAQQIAADAFTKAEEYFFFIPCITPAPQPGNITAAGGNTKVCPGDTKSYSINPVTNATSYQWTPPGGAIITSGQGTTSIIIQFNAGFTMTDSLKVSAVNSCGPGPYRGLKITINKPSTPELITGAVAEVCPNTTGNYSVPPVAGINYNWTPPPGAEINSGQGTNTVSVNFLSSFNNGYIEVTASNGCGTSSKRRVKIYSIPSKPGTIAGMSSGVCGQQAVPYSVPFVAGVNYQWTVPTGAIIASGQGTHSITVDFTGSVVSGKVAVTANNLCGSSAQRNMTIKTTPPTPGTITGPILVCANQQEVQYSIAPVPTATGYTWTGPSGSQISDGVNTSVGNSLTTGSTDVTVNYGAASGYLSVKATNACGNGSGKQITITFNCRQSGSRELVQEFSVYPNPASDFIYISGTGLSGTLYKLALQNVLGQSLENKVIYPVDHYFKISISMKHLPAGLYFLTLQSDHSSESYRIEKR